MKYLKGIVVIVLVFLFPAVSYWYLRSGFIYRRDALEELKNEVAFTNEQKNTLLALDSNFIDKISDEIFIVMKLKDERDEKDLYFIAENLKSRRDFRVLGLYTHKDLPSYNDTIYQKILSRKFADTEALDKILNDNRFILGKNGVIRNQYGDSIEMMKKLYEHAIILLPMKKREKIDLKRDKEI